VSGMRRWRWPAAAAVLIIAVAGVALLRADGNSSRHPIGIREGGTVRVAALFEPSGFNPNTTEDSGPGLQDVAVAVYPSVFRIHPDFSVQLDQTFMVSAELTSHDPQTITYQIRPEAHWSDGTPITADDFHYLWQHLNGSIPKTDAYTITGYEQIKEVTGSAAGKTVTVVFSTPFAEWQGLFTNLLPAHYVRRQPGGWNRGLAEHPEDIPSGGAFRIAGFTPGETVTLARNDNYWAPKAHLDAIQFRLVQDSDAQVAALRNREADLIRPQATTDLINIVKRLPGVQSQVRTSLGFEHLTFNLKHPILAEPAVRKAIATAIDTRQLVDRLLVPVNPDAQPLGNRIWLAGQQPYQDHTGGYTKGNTPAAKQLLERAGWTLGDDEVYSKNGRRLRLRLATFTGDPRRRAEGVLLQAQLAKAGIQLTLFNTANKTLFGVWLPEGNFDIADVASVGGPLALSGNQDTYRPGGGGNYARFTDPTVNALFQQAIGELDPARAAALGNQIDQRLWDQLPSIPLYQLQAFLAWRQDLLNVGNNPTIEGPFWNAGTWAFAKP
jgi:peptide/nickel transport system substrate-binding protein